MFASKKIDYMRLQDCKDNTENLRDQSQSHSSIMNQSGCELNSRLLQTNNKYQYLSQPHSSANNNRLLHDKKTQLFDMKNANDETCTSSFVSFAVQTECPQRNSVSCFQKVKGLLIMLVGVILFDLARFTVKLCYKLNRDITPMEQSVIRLTFMLTFITVFISCSLQIKSVMCKIPKKLKCLLAARSVIGGLYAIFMGCALLQLKYSTAVTLSFTAPLLAPLAAYFVLRQKVKACDVIALLVSFMGVLIFTNPQIFQSEGGRNSDRQSTEPGQENHLIGFVFIILASSCRAIDISFLKKLTSKYNDSDDIGGGDQNIEEITDRYGRIIGTNRVVTSKDSHFIINVQQIPRLYEQKQQGEKTLLNKNMKMLNILTPVFYMTLTGTLLSIIGFQGQQLKNNNNLITGLIDKIDLSVVVCLSISGLFTLLAQYFYSTATKHQSASRLAGVFYFQIITAFLFEAFVFHGNIGIAEVIGTSIILASSVSVAIMKVVGGSNQRTQN